MKTKKFLGVLIVLTVATSTLAFTGKLQIIYPSLSQILFASAEGNEQPVPFDSPKADVPPTKILSPKPFVPKAVEATDEVPDKIVYFILFRHLVSLKEQATKAAAVGKTFDYLGLYEKQANLDNTQSLFLFDTAQECMDVVKLIDNQAKEIIMAQRAKFDELKSQDAELPPPPAELKELQNKKDEKVLEFRDKLKSFFGESQFSQFNDFARQKIAPQVTNINKKEDK